MYTWKFYGYLDYLTMAQLRGVYENEFWNLFWYFQIGIVLDLLVLLDESDLFLLAIL